MTSHRAFHASCSVQYTNTSTVACSTSLTTSSNCGAGRSAPGAWRRLRGRIQGSSGGSCSSRRYLTPSPFLGGGERVGVRGVWAARWLNFATTTPMTLPRSSTRGPGGRGALMGKCREGQPMPTHETPHPSPLPSSDEGRGRRNQRATCVAGWLPFPLAPQREREGEAAGLRGDALLRPSSPSPRLRGEER